jgi:hypothetical protein
MSGYYSKKVAAPTPKGITFLEKYLEALYCSRPATFVKEKVNKTLSWNWRNEGQSEKANR